MLSIFQTEKKKSSMEIFNISFKYLKINYFFKICYYLYVYKGFLYIHIYFLFYLL